VNETYYLALSLLLYYHAKVECQIVHHYRKESEHYAERTKNRISTPIQESVQHHLGWRGMLPKDYCES